MDEFYQKILNEEIKSFENDAELDYFRDNIEKMLVNMLSYSDTKYNNLVKKVEDSILYSKREYDIYTTAINKDDMNLYKGTLFPIIEPAIGEADNDGFVTLKAGILKMSYRDLKELENSSRTFTGRSNGTEFEIFLRRSKTAENKVEELYNVMTKNMVEWRPVLAPYLWKYYEFVMKEDESADYENIEIDLEELENYWQEELIPVWNVKSYEARMSKGAVAVREKYNYEYKFLISDFEKCSSVLLNATGGEILDTVVNNSEISVIAESKDMSDWICYEIRKTDLNNTKPELGVFSNSDSGANFGYRLRTKSAFEAIFKSSKNVNEYFEFEEVNLVSEIQNCYETYPLNKFIDNEFDKLEGKKIIEIKVREKKYDIVSEDIISYIKALVELFHPEFTCVVMKDD